MGVGVGVGRHRSESSSETSSGYLWEIIHNRDQDIEWAGCVSMLVGIRRVGLWMGETGWVWGGEVRFGSQWRTADRSGIDFGKINEQESLQDEMRLG